jgi:glutamate--cysteine ligase catalytic subunit
MENRVLNMYTDIPVPIDEEYYMQLRDSGVDPALSQHIAHLFIRDPLVIFDGAVEELDDETQTEHFESIQSTNWQTVRWKPPPPRNNPNDPHIGWRTEFRSMEMQMTDFENAAFTVFIVLLTRTILTFDLNLYIPISRVDTNMQRAHSRNASAKGKFFFRRHMAPLEEGDDGYGVKYTSMFSRVASTSALSAELLEGEDDGSTSTTTSSTRNATTATTTAATTTATTTATAATATTTTFTTMNSTGLLDENGTNMKRKKAPVARGSSDEENSFEEMTMKEIMTGKGDYFPGLIPLVRAYLDHINADDVAHAQISKYLDFIELRSKGELVTPATWMRNFVRNHPAYKNDSHVNQEIAYDLMMACKDIGEGKRHEKSLLGDFKISPVSTKGAYDGGVLGGESVGNDDLLKLLRRYSKRKAFNRTTKKSSEQGSSSIVSESISGSVEDDDKALDMEMDTHSLIK